MNDNKITINLQFKEYEFRRVKHMGSNPVVYTTKDWNRCYLGLDKLWNIAR